MTGTIIAQLIVEGATKRVVQDLPQHEKLWCMESTCQELVEWLGAWVRKQGSLHLHWVLFIPCGYTSDLQPADIAIQQPAKHSIKQQGMQFFPESVCRNDAVLDLRLSEPDMANRHELKNNLGLSSPIFAPPV